METVKEKVIEGRNVDRVKFIGSFDYKSTGEGFAGKKFNRYSVMGITFRAHGERDIDFINDLKAKKVGAIYLVPQKDVVVGKNDKGEEITKDVIWDFDGYSLTEGLIAHAKAQGLVKAYSEGKFFDIKEVASLPDLEKLISGKE